MEVRKYNLSLILSNLPVCKLPDRFYFRSAEKYSPTLEFYILVFRVTEIKALEA